MLIKILDAREKLSLQVHPPENVANRLGGEPKSEFWYIAAADQDAELFLGFREPITHDIFKERLRDGTVTDHIHRIAVQPGDAVFLPAGRLHEKDSTKYCFGVCGAICVGTGLRDYHHNNHYGRQRDNYRVQSGQRDCA